jgi:hypothetical protein
MQLTIQHESAQITLGHVLGDNELQKVLQSAVRDSTRSPDRGNAECVSSPDKRWLV